MKTRIVKIGNSQGIRIPKLLLERSNLAEEVEVEAEDHQIIIRSTKKPRHDWVIGRVGFEQWRTAAMMLCLITICSLKLDGIRMSGNGSQTL